MTTKITLTKTGYSSKPLDYSALNYPAAFKPFTLTVEEFFDYVANRGYGFRLQHLKRGATSTKTAKENESPEKENNLPGNLIVFDVDDGTVSAEEYVKTVLEPLNLVPSFVAYSWNDANAPYELRLKSTKPGKPINETKRKFHIIYVLDVELENFVIENILKEAVNVLPDVDKIKDRARLFNGSTNGGTVYNTEPLKLETLPLFYELAKGGVEDIIDAVDKTNKNKKEKVLNERYNLVPSNVLKVPATVETLPDILKRWNLFNRFSKGEKLSYEERGALFLNLNFIFWGNKNGNLLDDYVEKVLENSTCYDDIEAKIKQYYEDKQKARYARYIPELNGTLAEYVEKVLNGGFYNARNNANAVSPDEGAKLLKEALNAAVQNNGLNLITVDCGLGKTEATLDVCFERSKDVFTPTVYVAPTYQNLYDFADRLKEKYDLNAYVLPEKELDEDGTFDVSLGCSSATSNERAEFFRNFSKLNVPDGYANVFCITHKLFLCFSNLPGLCAYVIDEDITDEYVPAWTFKPSELDALYSANLFSNGEWKPFEFFNTTAEMTDALGFVEFPETFFNSFVERFNGDNEEAKNWLKQKVKNGSVPAAPYFRFNKNANDYRLIGYKNEDGLPEFCIAAKKWFPERNITLLTATPKQTLIDVLSAKRGLELKTTKLPNITHVGLNVQIILTGIRRKKTANEIKAELEKAKSAVERMTVEAKKVYPELADVLDEPFEWITFKNWCAAASTVVNVAQHANGKQFYLGNVAGYDDLKGKNLVSYGATKKPSKSYWALYYAYVYEPENKNTPLLTLLDGNEKELDENGLLVRKLRFNVDVMTNIRDDDIKADEMQTIGRSRVVRERCITALFSNIPSPDTDVFFCI